MTSQAFLAKVLKAKSQQVMVIAIIVVLSAIVYLRLDLHANSGKKKKSIVKVYVLSWSLLM